MVKNKIKNKKMRNKKVGSKEIKNKKVKSKKIRKKVNDGMGFKELPFGRGVVLSVLAFVMAVGGYGGYKVVKDYGKYGVDFDKRNHQVVGVVDGDTIVVGGKREKFKSKNKENKSESLKSKNSGNGDGINNSQGIGGIKVRLLGIDAPELEECYGEESAMALRKIIIGNKITLEKDQTAKDSFGRLLRYVFVADDSPEIDSIFVNKKMIEGGFAKVKYIKPDKRYLAVLQAAEREAQKNERGLWGACESNNSVNLEREIASEPVNKKCVIKGNINKRYEKDYFLPGCPNYKRVIVDIRKGEKWFCSEVEAQKEGWQLSAGCGNLRK